LPATRITPDVDARARSLFGRVRSVHRAAIYIDLDRVDGILVVAIDDVGGVPGCILVQGSRDLRETGIRPRMAFGAESNGWSIPSANVSITFDQSRTRVWSPALPAIASFRRTFRAAACVAAARWVAADRAPEGGLGPILARRAASSAPGDPWLIRARTLVDIQVQALRAGDVARAAQAAVDLIGLGTGLTPSGDDYLVGLLAGLEASGDPALDTLAATIAANAEDRTTTIGASMLGHAAVGAYSERLHDVLVAIAAGRVEQLATPIERAMAFGATSGADTLVGLFAALDLALARPRAMNRSAA
jgi:hypothetical protein